MKITKQAGISGNVKVILEKGEPFKSVLKEIGKNDFILKLVDAKSDFINLRVYLKKEGIEKREELVFNGALRQEQIFKLSNNICGFIPWLKVSFVHLRREWGDDYLSATIVLENAKNE